jgi:hypothetical protein
MIRTSAAQLILTENCMFRFSAYDDSTPPCGASWEPSTLN